MPLDDITNLRSFVDHYMPGDEHLEEAIRESVRFGDVCIFTRQSARTKTR